MFGRMYNEVWGRTSAVLIFLGFNFTFFPQFLLCYMGMPRRYNVYPPAFPTLQVLSTAGASLLALGYGLPLLYLFLSLRSGMQAGPNPWSATSLAWTAPN